MVAILGVLCVWLVPVASIVQADAIPVITQHNDTLRTGANLQETILTTTNVSQTTFGELFSRPLDGNMFAQPLYVPALTVKGAKHNILFAATEHNSVYAYDADSVATDALWKTTLPDVPTPLPNIYCCGNGNYQTQTYTDIQNELGITSTPAIDLTTNTIYVVAFGQSPRPGLTPVPNCSAGQTNAGCDYHYTIHALDLLTGREKTELGSPTVITATVPGCATYQDPTAPMGVARVLFQPEEQTQRPALLVHNGSIYITFGSFKDDNPYHGWVMRYRKDTLAQQAVFNTTPNADCQPAYSVGGGLWNSGQGPTVDPDTGDLYFTNSNGSYTVNTASGHDISNSVFRLDKDTLTLKGYFTPFDVNSYGRQPSPCQNSSGYNCYDLSSSSGNLLIPGTHLLLSTGKVGRFFLIDRSNQTTLGGQSSNDQQILQDVKVARIQPACLAPATTDPYARYNEGCTGKVYGAPVYWQGPNNAYIYVWPRYDSLKQVRFDPNHPNGQYFATMDDTTSPAAADPDANIPYVQYWHERPYSGANTEYTPAQGGGILSLSANGATVGTGILWAAVPIAQGLGKDRQRLTAYNAQDVTQKLWDSGDTLGLQAKFVPPTIVNGHVYLPSFYEPAPASQMDPLNVNRLHVFGLLNSAVSLAATGFPAAVTAGQQRTITVTLKDKNGNPAAGYLGTVQLTSSDPLAILPPPHTFTAGDGGSFTFNVTLRSPGVQTITATDVNAGGLTATQANITVTGLTLTAISLGSGPIGGGTPVTITGTGFASGVSVTFGGVAGAVSAVNMAGTALTVITPAHATGIVDVVVSVGGVNAILPQAYEFVVPQAAGHGAAAASPRPVAPQPPGYHPPEPTVVPAMGTPIPQPVRH